MWHTLLRKIRERRSAKTTFTATGRRGRTGLRFEPLEDRTLLSAAPNSMDMPPGLVEAMQQCDDLLGPLHPDNVPKLTLEPWAERAPQDFDRYATLTGDLVYEKLDWQLYDVYRCHQEGQRSFDAFAATDSVVGDRIAIEVFSLGLSERNTEGEFNRESVLQRIKSAGLEIVARNGKTLYGHIAIDNLDDLAKSGGLTSGTVSLWDPIQAGIKQPEAVELEVPKPKIEAPVLEAKRVDIHMMQGPDGAWFEADPTEIYPDSPYHIEIEDRGNGTRVLRYSPAGEPEVPNVSDWIIAPADGAAVSDADLPPGALISLGEVDWSKVPLATYNVDAAGIVNTSTLNSESDTRLDLTASAPTEAVFESSGILTLCDAPVGAVTQLVSGAVMGQTMRVAGAAAGPGEYADAHGMATAASLRAFRWIAPIQHPGHAGAASTVSGGSSDDDGNRIATLFDTYDVG